MLKHAPALRWTKTSTTALSAVCSGSYHRMAIVVSAKEKRTRKPDLGVGRGVLMEILHLLATRVARNSDS